MSPHPFAGSSHRSSKPGTRRRASDCSPTSPIGAPGCAQPTISRGGGSSCVKCHRTNAVSRLARRSAMALSYSPWNDVTIWQLRLVRGLSVNTLPNPRTLARCCRCCFMAVLALALGAAMAPFGSLLAAQKAEAGDKIVISGASGGLAGETLVALLERGVKLADLVLVTRTPEKLSSFSTNGAAVRVGDFDKPET